jgi:hypothetical protein
MSKKSGDTGMTNIQIKELYEKQNMAPEQIAEALGLEVDSVKFTLASASGKYRRAIDGDKTFEQTVMAEAVSVIGELLYDTDNPNIRLKAAKFVINENKGRHDVDAVKNLNINVNVFNMQLKQAREQLKRAKEANGAPVVDVEMSQAA